MGSVKTKDTAPELTVRKFLHSQGYRYTLHGKELPGHPDIVFTKKMRVVFVHGCYWHGHACKYGKLPKSRIDYWKAKIDRNIERDQENIALLKKLGWDVFVLWQCELKHPGAVYNRLITFLGSAATLKRGI